MTGYVGPAATRPAMVDGKTYRYRAESADLSQWEFGYGVYTASTQTIARTTIQLSSTGAKVSFTVPPQVGVTAFPADLFITDNAAAKTDMQTPTSSALVVTPAPVQNHPGVAKAWVYFSISGGVVTIQASYNVASVGRSAAGQYTASFTTPKANANIATLVTSSSNAVVSLPQVISQGAGSVSIQKYNVSRAALADPLAMSINLFRSPVNHVVRCIRPIRFRADQQAHDIDRRSDGDAGFVRGHRHRPCVQNFAAVRRRRRCIHRRLGNVPDQGIRRPSRLWLAGSSASFGISAATAAGSCAVAGVSVREVATETAPAGAFAVAGFPASLVVSIAAAPGSYALNGSAAKEPITQAISAGSFVITSGANTLIRTGADFDLVYGGVGHYLEELERQKQLAKITRKTPAPIVQPPRPRLPPLASPQPPAVDIQAVAAQRTAQLQGKPNRRGC